MRRPGLVSTWCLLSSLFIATPAEDQIHDTQMQHFTCGTSIAHASSSLLQAHKALNQQERARTQGPYANSTTQSGIPKRQSLTLIKTYAHLIASADPYSPKLLTPIMPQAQIQVLNQAYKGSGFVFQLAGMTWHNNTSWATGTDLTMQQTLRVGNYAVLNIYFVTNFTSLLGHCSLPTNVGSNPSLASIAPDGCVIQASTMPAAPKSYARSGYNKGYTLVHEVGHWLGLFHVFEGNSCDPAIPGDYVDDTPVQSTATTGCPKGKDSCPMQAGEDSLHNFMDYSVDACYTGFSVGQWGRMQMLWGMFRARFSG